MAGKVMRCPVCHEVLAHVSFRGVEVDLCYGCRGIWLDPGELKQLLKDAPETSRLLKSRKPFSRSREKRRPCPRCGDEMEKMTIGIDAPVVADRCPGGHGEWYDRGELRTLLEQGGLDTNHLMVRLLSRVVEEAEKEPD